MSVLTLPPPTLSTAPVVVSAFPQRKQWTCAEFHQLGDEGWFEHCRALLVEGEILIMSVPNPPHSTSTALTADALRPVFGPGYLIRSENPLELGLKTDPAPDVAAVFGSIRQFAVAHPTTAELIVEVSDSTLHYDTGDKACLYAAARIEDYWVVDLIHRRLLVFRDPQPDAGKPYGFRYASMTTYLPGQSVSPLAIPGSVVAVADLLP